jgi:glycerol uptake facilitator-like aquaporin
LETGGYALDGGSLHHFGLTASTSFANPAVTIARSLTNTFAGIGPTGVPPFIVAQLLGAIAAAGLSLWLLRKT